MTYMNENRLNHKNKLLRAKMNNTNVITTPGGVKHIDQFFGGSHPDEAISSTGLLASYHANDGFGTIQVPVVAFGRNNNQEFDSGYEPYRPCVLNSMFEVVYADSLDGFHGIHRG